VSVEVTMKVKARNQCNASSGHEASNMGLIPRLDCLSGQHQHRQLNVLSRESVL
jgi:hypothetical protein